jgi:hypothetical protein
MKNKGPDTRQNRVNSNYNPFLERVKQVQVVAQDSPNAESPCYIDVTRDEKDYGAILTKENMGNGVEKNWIVLLPKYLKPTRPSNPSDLRDDVFPTYNIGDQLFIGRLYVPINVYPALELLADTLKNKFKNNHPLVIDDYYQKDKSLSKGRVWNKVYPDIAAFYDHRVGNNPEYMAYYIDLNVDGRNRTPATTATSDEGKNAPNVWL